MMGSVAACETWSLTFSSTSFLLDKKAERVVSLVKRSGNEREYSPERRIKDLVGEKQRDVSFVLFDGFGFQG